jgi:hypothetical protein
MMRLNSTDDFMHLSLVEFQRFYHDYILSEQCVALIGQH